MGPEQHDDCPGAEEFRALIRDTIESVRGETLLRHLEWCSECVAAYARLLEEEPCDEVEDWVGVMTTAAIMSPIFRQTREELFRIPDTATQLAVPPIFDQYEMLEPLGQGATGRVYKARHRHLGRIVAIKLLSPDRLPDERQIQNFYREMAVIGRLQHPHIVHAIDSRPSQGFHALIMEYVDGAGVAYLLGRTGPMPLADAAEIARQAALGLEYAHEQGLVHRDIKPSNLFLSNGGTVKLLDFGLAGTTAPGAHTMTDWGGTPNYMSPEQFAGKSVDIRSDLYALGCTLFKLLTGSAPYSTVNDDSSIGPREHHAGPIPSLRARKHDIPEEFDELVARLLAKSPADRPATPAEVESLLQPWSRGANLSGLVRRAIDSNHDTVRAHAEETIEATRAGTTKTRRSPIRFKSMSLIVFLLVVSIGGIEFVRRMTIAQPVKSMWQKAELSGRESVVSLDVGHRIIPGEAEGEPSLRVQAVRQTLIRLGRIESLPTRFRFQFLATPKSDVGMYFAGNTVRDAQQPLHAFHIIRYFDKTTKLVPTSLEWTTIELTRADRGDITRMIERLPVEKLLVSGYQTLEVEVGETEMTLVLNGTRLPLVQHQKDTSVSPIYDKRLGDFGIFVDHGEATFRNFEWLNESSSKKGN